MVYDDEGEPAIEVIPGTGAERRTPRGATGSTRSTAWPAPR